MKKEDNNDFFAVIDTETNYENNVMSIGVVIANKYSFIPIDTKYYIVSPDYKIGGLFSNMLFLKNQTINLKDSRSNVISDLNDFLYNYDVVSLFAYNAHFDFNHLPELKNFSWYDIMKLAAYKQYNKYLPANASYCSTGRLTRNYKVESIMRCFVGSNYYEKHNALYDSIDELKIMNYLGCSYDKYNIARIF